VLPGWEAGDIMQGRWLHKNDNASLLMFFNGWGMDHNPLSCLESSRYDVYMYGDYRQMSLPEDHDELFSHYADVGLIAWSMGVWVAWNLLQDEVDRYRFRIAVNGTLCPIDDSYGIPVVTFAETLAKYSEDTRQRFYRRMCRTRNNLEKFLACQPKRSLQGQRQELEILANSAKGCTLPGDSFYHSAIVSGDDRIMLTTNQLAFWERYPNVMTVQRHGAHYCFPDMKSWDELVDICALTP